MVKTDTVKRHGKHSDSMDSAVALAVGIPLVLLLSGCVLPPEGPSGPEPGPTGDAHRPSLARDGVETADFHAHKYHRFGWKATCPAAPGPEGTEERPRLQITPTNTTFVAGDIQCFTVSFTNTADRSLEYTPPSWCHTPVVSLHVEGTEDTPFLPLELRQQDTPSCTTPTEQRMAIEPGQRLSHTFVWDGTGIIDGFGPPFLSEGAYTLVARLAGDPSWNVTARLDVTLTEDPEHPTRPCLQVPRDTSPSDTPRMQIRLDQNVFRSEEWFCIPMVVYNGSDRAFNLTTGSSCREPSVRFIPLAEDQKPLRLTRRILCFQAVTTHTLEPGGSWSWLYWWPALDHRSGEHLIQVSLAGRDWNATAEQTLTLT